MMPDDGARPVVHGDLLDRQERQRRGPRLRRQRLLHRLDVVRHDHDQQRHLLRRVDGRLAGLLDQQRLDLVAVLAEPDGVAGQHLGAALGAALLPLLLRLAQAGGDARHVGGVGPAHLRRRRRRWRGCGWSGRSRVRINFGRRGHAAMLTIGVICVAPGLTPVKFGHQGRHAHHCTAKQQRPDGVGEVVVRHALTDRSEHAEHDRRRAPPTWRHRPAARACPSR